MSDEDRKCNGLVKGGEPRIGHKNRDPKDWLDGTKHVIETTRRDIAYYTKRLVHLQSLHAKIDREDAAAVPTIEPHLECNRGDINIDNCGGINIDDYGENIKKNLQSLQGPMT